MDKYNSDSLVRYWSRVDCSAGLFECWLWTADCDRDGYGRIWMNGRGERAHRIAWELGYNDEIPEGLIVLHTCDNPACCQPLHLFLGTHVDNMRDKTLKGRQAHGHKIGISKLVADQVREIRERYAAGGISQTALGREYGVTGVAISCIVRGKVWKTLD